MLILTVLLHVLTILIPHKQNPLERYVKQRSNGFNNQLLVIPEVASVSTSWIRRQLSSIGCLYTTYSLLGKSSVFCNKKKECPNKSIYIMCFEIGLLFLKYFI